MAVSTEPCALMKQAKITCNTSIKQQHQRRIKVGNNNFGQFDMIDTIIPHSDNCPTHHSTSCYRFVRGYYLIIVHLPLLTDIHIVNPPIFGIVTYLD